MKTLHQPKVDFKMIKDDKTLEPKEKSRTRSSLIWLLTGAFIFGKIKYRVILSQTLSPFDTSVASVTSYCNDWLHNIK